METFGGTIITAISTSSVGFLTDFVTDYWGVMLTIGGVLLLGRWFLKLTNLGR